MDRSEIEAARERLHDAAVFGYRYLPHKLDAMALDHHIKALETALRNAEHHLARFMDSESEGGLRRRARALLGDSDE